MSKLQCVVPENIHTPPPPTGKDLPYDPSSPLDFPKSALKIYPPSPLRNFQKFRTPPGTFAISN